MIIVLTAQQQAPPQRLGTVRGRREMRNSYIPPPVEQQIPETEAAEIAPAPVAPVPETTSREPVQTNVASPPVASPSSPGGFSPAGGLATSTFSPFSPADNSSPFRPASRQPGLGADLAGDTQSIRSGRSLTSTGSQGAHRHPDLTDPGLNTSIIETVNARFENGALTSSSLIGEIALAYNPPDFSTPFGTDTLRLDNFSRLEKVAPNPAFISPVPDKEGEYAVSLASILAKPQVAFKYQAPAGASAAPLLLSLATKIEPAQTSIILSYSLNPAYQTSEPLALSNVVLALSLDGAKASSCLSKPVGTFARDRNLIFWPLGDVVLSPGAAPAKLLARFATEGEARGGAVEARWELGGGGGVAVGVSVRGESGGEADPFADEEVGGGWRVCGGSRRVVGGSYVGK